MHGISKQLKSPIVINSYGLFDKKTKPGISY